MKSKKQIPKSEWWNNEMLNLIGKKDNKKDTLLKNTKRFIKL